MKWCIRIVVLSVLMISGPVIAASTTPKISGLIEVEAASAEDFSGNHTIDTTLSTVELRVDATLQNLISAHVGFLYEEDETDFGLDEATITIGPSGGKSFVFGKMYVPFGRLDSFMVSDPQTLVMAETVETVLMLAVENAAGYGSLYLFSGDSDESSVVASGDDDTVSGGFNLGRRDAERYDIGVGYITNIGDSDTLQALGTGSLGEVESNVPGASVHLQIRSGNTVFLAEHIMALESFSNGDLGGTVSDEEQPVATNVEVAFVRAGGSVLALGYQTTDEAQFIGLPRSVTSLVMRKEFIPGASLALEFAQMEDYATIDGGTGKTANAITLQIAMEF